MDDMDISDDFIPQKSDDSKSHKGINSAEDLRCILNKRRYNKLSGTKNCDNRDNRIIGLSSSCHAR